MESKHIPSTAQVAENVHEPNHPPISDQEISSHLADIELKLDHLIERIHDSLFRFKTQDEEDKDAEEE